MIDTDDLEQMYVEIVLGVPKGESKFSGLDPDLWDKISAEVAAMKANGQMPEMINEIPMPNR